MSDLSKLISQYKNNISSMSGKQTAEAEKHLVDAWMNVNLQNPSADARNEWIRNTLGVKTQDYEMRSMLLRAGQWVDHLWKMHDHGTPIRTIVRLFREARDEASTKQVSHHQALEKVINQYENTGFLAHTKDGKIYRRPGPSMKTEIGTPFSQSDNQKTRSSNFISQVSTLATEYVRTSILPSGLDEVEIQKPIDEFVSFVNEACEDLRKRVTSIRSHGLKDAKKQKISRDGLRRACEVLGISAVYGRPVNLRSAKKIMFKRAAELHPDKCASTTSTREYQAVIEAYHDLETYMEGLKTNEHGNHDHESQ